MQADTQFTHRLLLNVKTGRCSGVSVLSSSTGSDGGAPPVLLTPGSPTSTGARSACIKTGLNEHIRRSLPLFTARKGISLLPELSLEATRRRDLPFRFPPPPPPEERLPTRELEARALPHTPPRPRGAFSGGRAGADPPNTTNENKITTLSSQGGKDSPPPAAKGRPRHPRRSVPASPSPPARR